MSAGNIIFAVLLLLIFGGLSGYMIWMLLSMAWEEIKDGREKANARAKDFVAAKDSGWKAVTTLFGDGRSKVEVFNANDESMGEFTYTFDADAEYLTQEATDMLVRKWREDQKRKNREVVIGEVEL